jgi:hypothetical protein
VVPEKDMVDKTRSSTNNSDSHLHLARIALRDLFTGTWLASDTGLWYAEVKLYGNNDKWWPLFSKYYRTKTEQKSPFPKKIDYLRQFNENGDLKRPDFYGGYEKSTESSGVLSVVNAVHEQFQGKQEHISPLPLFAVFDSSQTERCDALQNALIERANAIAELTDGRYLTLFSKDENGNTGGNTKVIISPELVDKYVNYVNRVMNRMFSLSNEIKGRLYPQQAWLYSIPIYEIRNGRQLLLATFIIIVEGTAEDLNSLAAKDKFRVMDRLLLSLAVDATYLLSHRFYHDIDGYVPGTDPIVLLAHPGLSKQDNLNALRLEDVGHTLEKFIPAYLSQDSILRRAYARSFKAMKTRKIRSLIAKDIKLNNNASSQRDIEDKQVESDCAYFWIKPLYAHQYSRARRPQEPSDNGEYHHRWSDLPSLCKLISMTVDKRRNNGQPFTTVSLYPVSQDNSSFRYFHWPVEPGIRLLIPWMHMLQRIETINGANWDSMQILVICGTDKPWEVKTRENKNWDKGLIRGWIDSQNDKDPRPNGLLAAFHSPKSSDKYKNERLVRGWTRTLSDPLRRKGADTTLFRNVILGDVGAAMRDKGLVYPPSDPFCLPLESSMPIEVDIKASNSELLVAVTWKAIPGKPYVAKDKNVSNSGGEKQNGN